MYPVIPAFDEKPIRAKIEIIERICQAVRDYLCFDMEQMLQRQSNPKDVLVYKPTTEMLVEAQASLEATREKIRFFENADENNVGAKLMAGLMLPDLKLSLQREEAYLSRIQESLEAQKKRPGG